MYPRYPKVIPKMGHLHPTELSLLTESSAEQGEGDVGREGEEGGVETRTWFPEEIKRWVATVSPLYHRLIRHTEKWYMVKVVTD